MASKAKTILSLLVAGAGAAGMGALISAQHSPSVDPIVTGSSRSDPRMQARPDLRTAKARTHGTPSREEVRVFFDTQLKQVRNR